MENEIREILKQGTSISANGIILADWAFRRLQELAGMTESEELLSGEEMLPGEDMDGDHASALASAGMGTDEDYGCYDGHEDLGWDGGWED